MQKKKKNIIIRICRRLCHIVCPPPTPEQLAERKKKADYEFLISHGVETEYGYVTLLGEPIIYKASNSRIVIGKGVTLVSTTHYNYAGINHPVILATQRPGAEIHIGDGSGFSGTTVVAFEKVEIGKNFGGGANTCIYDGDFHGIKASERVKDECVKVSPVKIGDDVWMAAGSMVLKGVIIGDRAVVGAMSLVNKNVEADSIYAGNPAKFVRKIEQ